MEYWESEADDGLILFTDPYHPHKNRSRSIKPSIPWPRPITSKACYNGYMLK